MERMEKESTERKVGRKKKEGSKKTLTEKPSREKRRKR